MKIIHIADLHIGKVVNGFSMLDEQAYVLNNVITMIKDNQVETLIIAGDIYDKRNPSDESVKLFNHFLNEISKLNITTLIISGNHDSAIKLSFGNELLLAHNIHIVGKVESSIHKVVLEDQYGSINFYLLPFIRISDVRHLDASLTSYHDAVKCALTASNINYQERNIFIGHQFFASGSEETSDSEQISVGGSDNVGYNLLLDFDYAALGHLHRPQKLKVDYIRYSGSIVTYSESEVSDNKSLVLIDFKAKGDLQFELLPLKTVRQFIKKKGYLDELLQAEPSDDYMFITLYDELVVDALGKLRNIYPNLMSLNFDNQRTKVTNKIEVIDDVEVKSPINLFKKFYGLQNNRDLNDNQIEIITKVVERIDDNATN